MKINKIVDIWEGEYRLFFNFYNGNKKITLGFPLRNTSLSDVYVKINNQEQPRISIKEAKNYLTQGMVSIISSRVKGLSSGPSYALKQIEAGSNSKDSNYGYCKECGKKLRGDKSKDLCYECWSNS
jgi:hypothetical protein